MADLRQDAAMEALRRGLPLRMGRRGHFFYEDDPVTHPRVVALFRRGLDVSEQGEPIVRVGSQWAYVRVADCVLRATGVDEVGDQLVIDLDDGRRLPLDPRTLWEEPGSGLRCEVPSAPTGRPLTVRFSNPAQLQLSERLTWDDAAARPRLHIGGVTVEIPDRAPTVG